MDKKLNILMVAYEAAPFYKRGGLGDVMESLPKALMSLGVDARVVIPYYSEIKNIFSQEKIATLSIKFDSSKEHVEVYKGENPQGKGKVYFLKNKRYLKGPNVRGRNKRIDQFAFFDLAVAYFILWMHKNKHWTANAVHCNDWHTSLLPLILSKKFKLNIPTLLTIHNLNYQGVGSLKVLDILQIEDENTKEIKRGKPATEINLLGEGIIHATRVSTVSKSYAREISEDTYGRPIRIFLQKRLKEMGLDGNVIGILNGIDYDIWNPEVDKSIFKTYNNFSWEAGKAVNKYELLRELGLSDQKPTFSFIGRMVSQKGIDILIKAIKRIKVSDFNLIFLGSGTPLIEKSVESIAKIHPANIKAIVSYDEKMAHKLYAGSDFMIIPSHYEPCGLVQMIAMKYGTIPVAAKTGGLADSIEGGQNGILFKKNSVSDIIKSIGEALRIYYNPKHLQFMIMKAMKTDFSWDKSAKEYVRLYEEMIGSLKH